MFRYAFRYDIIFIDTLFITIATITRHRQSIAATVITTLLHITRHYDYFDTNITTLDTPAATYYYYAIYISFSLLIIRFLLPRCATARHSV